MSSAALQAVPHQPTTVGTHSPVAATSNRQYASTSSQSREPYYQAYTTSSPQQNNTTSPSSTRRPSRRPSGNGPASSTQSPSLPSSHQPHYAPSPTTASVNNHRVPTSTHAPSGTSNLSAATMAPGDHQRGVPPVVSPRTSSNRTQAHASSSRTADRAETSRRPYPTELTGAPRPTGDATHERDDRQRSNGMQNGTAEDYAAATRARRRGQQSPEGIPHRPSPSASREPRAHSAQRQQPTPPTNLSREASEVLNRMVVSKPEEDLVREKERMAEAVPSSPPSQQQQQQQSTPVAPPSESADTEPRGSRSRHDHSTSKPGKNSKFGDYYLGNVLGEGEFGKVRMGWKQGSDVQVAVKLMRKDTVGSNPTRLAKVHREIQILREVQHPNIVRLHEMVETETKIGIILEYASGGELFDHILNHRYLKDNAARRLFAQLVSGVGYMHKKGIVHRDLKLENLLLDRNRNIIITDFGFANTFNPADELGEEVEYNLSSREYIKRMELDKILPNGMRRGDLMQTSCGSPCYAAPELVVSDSLYTGRKVDVWSCGVILYAMLAGYLPFDDDPANPEGDNINLLYKYIVSTPLTFPEYVTPHARDLLRRILVPDPRKRADLFEVARHSWLSEYAHVVGFITSGTTTTSDIANTHIGSEEEPAPALGALGRSASVREPSKSSKTQAAIGELGRKHGNVDPADADVQGKPVKDTKRRTLQVEYMPPQSETKRGPAPSNTTPTSKTRARSGSQGPVEVSAGSRRQPSIDKPLPKDPSPQDYSSSGRRPGSSQRQQGMAPPTRPGREQNRSASDTAYANAPPVSLTRPQTGGSIGSNLSRSGSIPLANRGSYSQPVAPTVAGTNAHGRMSQPPPKSKNYSISAPLSPEEQPQYGQPSISQVPSKFAQVSGFSEDSQPPPETKTHKRSSTIGSIFSRTNSIFGGKSGRHGNNAAETPQEKPEKAKKSYPPVSMGNSVGHDAPRPSMDSRRSISFGFGKKRSGSITGGSQTTLSEKPRRFSLLPASFSLKAIGIGKEEDNRQDDYGDRPASNRHYDEPPQTARTDGSRVMTAGGNTQHYASDGAYDRARDSPRQNTRTQETSSPSQSRYPPTSQPSSPPTDPRSGIPPQFLPPMNFRQDQSTLTTESESSLNDLHARRAGPGIYPPGFNEYDPRPGQSSGQAPYQRQSTATSGGNNGRAGVLQKPNRRFNDTYEGEASGSHTGVGYEARRTDHAGSSGAARKVMDFFRRRRRDNE